jgi:ABC-2 type transport system permease protein
MTRQIKEGGSAMNILKQELKMSFRSWLYFTAGMLATLVIFASFFNIFKSDAALLDQLLQNFPQEFKAAFGFADVSLAEIDGYFSFLISYIVLIGAIYGMKLSVSLLSEEYRAKTSDFLLSKPVRRVWIVTSKFLAVLICLAAQNILLFGIGIAAVNLVVGDSIDMGVFALLSFSNFFVQLFFVGIGLALAALLQKIKSVMPITLGVVFFFFIIELINESLLEKPLTYLTPFSYFKGSAILSSHSYDPAYLLIDLAVFVVFTLLGYWIYQKRDVHSI